MDLTRRCFLQMFGGAAAGVAFSPLPWKLVDDAAIWTQNWSWLPRPPKGPVSLAHTTCTLCPAGCGLRVRRIGPHPVATTAVAGHPVGGACALGQGLAQVRFHPARLRQAARRRPSSSGPAWEPLAPDAAVAEVGRRVATLRAAGRGERLAVLDLGPGRALSVLDRELAAAAGGHYLTAPDGRLAATAALADLVDPAAGVPGYDLGAARAVVSFGAPLLDGWCGAGAARELIGRQDGLPFLVQVQSCGSLETTRSDRWLAVRPGTEGLVALGLGRVLLDEGLVRGDDDATGTWLPVCRELLAPFTPERVAFAAQIDLRSLQETARDLAARRPAVAVGVGDPGAGPLGQAEEWAVWCLNLLLGAVGRPGGVVLRRDAAGTFGDVPATAATTLDALPDGSLDLLLVDATAAGPALPPALLRRKLAGPDALLVVFGSGATGVAAAADLVLPVAAPGEWRDDVPAQALAAVNSYAWAPPLAMAPEGIPHPADLLAAVTLAAGLDGPLTAGRARHEELLQARAAALHAGGTGTIFDPADGRTTPVAALAAREVAVVLARGGCWREPPQTRSTPPALRPADTAPRLATAFAALGAGRLPTGSDTFPLTLVFGGGQVAGAGLLPPVANKLYRESHLKPGPGRVRLNPVTAGRLGLREGKQASLVTPAGRCPVGVAWDEAVMPGVVLAAVGPAPAALGDPAGTLPDGYGIVETDNAARTGVWRVGRASLEEV
ncbi:MAG: molybdopterin dinucleotide binding domain-containing protein [Candidatus Krumholzibacteriia bacterium]